MAQDLPYSVVYGKVGELLKKIADAKVPDSFSHAFLKDTLGFKSSNDRNLIGLLKSLGIIDGSGKPTVRYRELKNDKTRSSAVAAGVMEAYAPLFEANEQAQDLPTDDLKGLIAQVAGTDKDMTSRIYYTLNALIKEAEFSAATGLHDLQDKTRIKTQRERTGGNTEVVNKIKERSSAEEIRPDFHFNIQVHLPNNGSEETYLNIFNALRETFK